MSFETARDERKANREEMVRFHRDETELAGVLCLPEGAEPHPVMTFIHGSGPAGRNGYHGFPPLWQAFARRECASLSWDKPGVGESSGDWMVQTLQDRARECLAALTFLSQRSDIDARRMGVSREEPGRLGHSPSGADDRPCCLHHRRLHSLEQGHAIALYRSA